MKNSIICLMLLGSTAGVAQAQVKKTAVKTKSVSSVPRLEMKTLIDSFSYAAGVNIANNTKEQGITDINGALMVQGVEDVLKNRKTAIPADECNAKLQKQMGIFNERKEKEAMKLNAVERAKGEAFLQKNKLRKEVTTLPSGLQYEILKAGDPAGVKPTVIDTVVVNYVGTLVDGTQFDASTGRGPATFPVGGVIKGWTDILQMMTKGAQWKVYIPSDLAYGERGAGGAIPGGAALIFEITLEDIKSATLK